MDDKKVNHIGVIMDGNRRYAKNHSKKLYDGYLQGAQKAYDIVEWCCEENIKEITLYTFSLENACNRSVVEKKILEKLFCTTFTNLLANKKIKENEVKIRFIGRRSIISKELKKIIEKIEEKTKNYKKITVNIAFYYSGRGELVDAVRQMIDDARTGKLKKEDIDEDTVKKYTYLPESSYPEIILRTGYNRRLSNFLLWHCAYSEIYFIDKLWPQLQKQDLIDAIKKYENTEKNLGE